MPRPHRMATRAAAPPPRRCECVMSASARLHGSALTPGAMDSAHGAAKEKLGVYMSAGAKQLSLPLTLAELKAARRLVNADQRLYSWAHELFWERVACAEASEGVKMAC